MGPQERIRQCAATALDYVLQARVGLTMCGFPRISDNLEPVVANLCQILRESLSIENCQPCHEAEDGNCDGKSDTQEPPPIKINDAERPMAFRLVSVSM